jgi:hypothetical protein
MFSKEDLVKQYDKLTDEELFSNYKQLDTFSIDGQNALSEVIDKKGGIERLTNYIDNKAAFDKEKARITLETKEFAKVGSDIEFIKKTTTSSLLDVDTTNKIIEDAFNQASLEQQDRQVGPKTISGSIFGGLLASAIGGTILGVWLIQTHHLFYISLALQAFLSYLIINRITKQSKNNSAVFIATGISTLFAIGLGFLIFNIFG